MNTNCSYRAFGSCLCSVKCLSETAHIQIIVDRAPLIRPERQDIKTVIAFGVLVAMSVYFFGPCLDEKIHQQDLNNQESGVVAWKR